MDWRCVAASVAAAVFAVGAPAAAPASGTVLIQRTGQQPSTYAGARIQLINNTLNVTSPDGKGTLIVTRAACAYQGQILVCLPTGITLAQNGGVHPLDLKSGTVYANMTDTAQQLSHSSQQLAPRGILMTLQTQKGTFINVSGVLDTVAK